MSILERILTVKREELSNAMVHKPLMMLESELPYAPPVRPFDDAIRRTARINLIAELKKASPSKGVIRSDFDAEKLLCEYEASPASALSILTDERFFQGSVQYLTLAKHLTTKSVLRKDFIISEYQIIEARAWGADAVLLIVTALEPGQLSDLLNLTHQVDMHALVEVHDATELDIALQAGARIIGINNRDLKTFDVDINTTLRLRPLIPEDIIVVAESGIHTYEDVQRLEDAGIDAILVGEALMRAESPVAKARELLGM
ncbi:MAG TPA: indole-3-glycerol phosphate synthase TrpC [Armatimonadetes bacterium]|nr:indole-3-glycerol phosphate synthase TrpC [Armatimonadota bacterium]